MIDKKLNMQASIRKNLYKNLLIKSKTCNPLFFPFFYFLSHNLYLIRRNIRSYIFLLLRKKRTLPRKNLIEIERFGYTFIENFLKEDDFNLLCRELFSENQDKFRKFLNEGHSIEKFGDSYRISFSIEKLNNDSIAFKVFKKIKRLLKDISGHIVIFPSLSYESHKGDSDGQNNEIFHTDIYQPTFKSFLYLEDVKSFPFEYVKGTHSINFANFSWHLKCQFKNYLQNIRSNKNFNSKLLSLFGINLKGGSWRYNYTIYRKSQPKFISKNTISLKVKKNTLVIANTCGFHRKSPIKSLSGNQERKLLYVGERSFIFL